MSSTVSVTIGDTAIVADVVRVVRRQFPGASINEILRYCGLALTQGTREAERIVFGNDENTGISSDRIYGHISEDERRKIEQYIENKPEITSIADVYRAGMYFIAGENHDEALRLSKVQQGRPRKTKEAIP